MTNQGFGKLTTLSDNELEQRLVVLLTESARTEADIVAHLAEVEGRKLHLRAGHPSMFQYCLEHLGLSENEAFHRIVAARLATAFPIIFELLAARELHLSAVCLLRRHLTKENHRELLTEACGKSKRQIEELLARRFPESVGSEARTARFKPVNADCYRLELYVTKAQKEKLELARDLVSHANRSGDWGIVIERAAEALTEKLQGRRFAKVKARRDNRKNVHQLDAAGSLDDGAQATEGHADRQTSMPSLAAPAQEHTAKRSPRRHIPNAVRRLVASRDEMSCTFTSEGGRRCGARAFLQLDHRQAWARGGEETSENLRVLCAQHNRLLAEQEFGAAAVRFGIDRRSGKHGEREAAACETRAPEAETCEPRALEAATPGPPAYVGACLPPLLQADARASPEVDGGDVALCPGKVPTRAA
jgi:hypothetical protein